MDFQDVMQFGAEMINPAAAQRLREQEEEERRRQQRIERGQSARAAAPRAQPGAMVMPAIPGPEDHARILGDMGKGIMAAFDKENTSRVSQARELRRMRHEKELKAMELEALIRRLDAARQDASGTPIGRGITVS